MQKGVVLLALAGVLLSTDRALADKQTIVDITGRAVEVEVPVRRVILGGGRQTFFTAVLDKENPFARVVGWRDDLRKADPDTYGAYREKFPEIDAIPTFGGFQGRYLRHRAGGVAATGRDPPQPRGQARDRGIGLRPQTREGRHPHRLCRLP